MAKAKKPARNRFSKQATATTKQRSKKPAKKKMNRGSAVKATTQLDPVMLSVARVIADRTGVNITQINKELENAGADALYARFIGPAIDQIQAEMEGKDDTTGLATKETARWPTGLTKVRFYIKRESNSEFTFANVIAQVLPDYTPELQFLEQLERALTEWVSETQNGRDAWEQSKQDFNVGDLSNVTGDKTLIPILEKHGIYGLTVECISTDSLPFNWTYDTVLMHPQNSEPAEQGVAHEPSELS